MARVVHTEAELGKAIKDGEDYIEVEGNLKDKVIRIKATGRVAWLIAFGVIAAAVAFALSTGGAGAPASLIAGSVPATILGLPAATACVSIAVAAGGVGALNKLRSYTLKKDNGKVILIK